MIMHPLPPVYNENSSILILGSFPSVKSRADNFYYAHPQNRFWRVLAAVCASEVPESIEDKKIFLLSHGIALWDVIGSCDISGSSDSSIRSVVPNDIPALMDQCRIHSIYVNGRTAEKYYNRFLRKSIDMDAVCLPSTSPANAGWSLDRLIQEWSRIRLDFSSEK